MIKYKNNELKQTKIAANILFETEKAHNNQLFQIFKNVALMLLWLK